MLASLQTTTGKTSKQTANSAPNSSASSHISISFSHPFQILLKGSVLFTTVWADSLFNSYILLQTQTSPGPLQKCKVSSSGAAGHSSVSGSSTARQCRERLCCEECVSVEETCVYGGVIVCG